MTIKDDWQIEDVVSGLRISVRVGEKLDILHIEHFGQPLCGNRDFFFYKDGGFDGTGSAVCEPQ